MNQPLSKDTKVEISCGLVCPILKYLSSRHGDDALQRFVSRCGVPEDYLREQGNWISFDCYNRLLDLLVAETGDPGAAYETSLFEGKARSTGALRVICRHLLSISTFYRMVVIWQRSYSKVADWEIRQLRPGFAELALRYADGYRQTRNNCESLKGFLAMIPQLAGQPAAEIRHSRCIVDGADACVYELRWKEPSSRMPSLFGCALLLAFGASFQLTGLLTSVPLSVAAVFLGGIGFLVGRVMELRRETAMMSEQNKEEAEALYESLRKIGELNLELNARVEERTSELSEANARLEKALSDLRESQSRVLLAEKQAAIGILAGGMAHEINNPISAIKLCMEALKELLGDREDLGSVIEVMGKSSDRAKRLVMELLTFSREPTKVGSRDIAEIVEDAVGLFEKEQPGSHEIVRNIERNLPLVRLDWRQVQQAVVNLLLNAWDATEGKGKIVVTLAREGDMVAVSVTDDGPGIDEALRQRIFDPFITTEKAGKKKGTKGTGLGLSITYQLVSRNGGTIDVLSEEGKGATFVIRFPISPDQGSELPAENAEPDNPG